MVEVLAGSKEWSIIRSCHKCQAKLKATREDLQIGHFGCNWGGERPERLPYFECPTCGNNIILKWDDVPANLDIIQSAK